MNRSFISTSIKPKTEFVVVNYDGKSFIYGYWPSEHDFPYEDSEGNNLTCIQDVVKLCANEANATIIKESHFPLYKTKFELFEFIMAEYGLMRQEEAARINVMIND